VPRRAFVSKDDETGCTVVPRRGGVQTSSVRAGESSIAIQPSQQGFGEGWAGTAEMLRKARTPSIRPSGGVRDRISPSTCPLGNPSPVGRPNSNVSQGKRFSAVRGQYSTIERPSRNTSIEGVQRSPLNRAFGVRAFAHLTVFGNHFENGHHRARGSRTCFSVNRSVAERRSCHPRMVRIPMIL
jgi:hypothetical protein